MVSDCVLYVQMGAVLMAIKVSMSGGCLWSV